VDINERVRSLEELINRTIGERIVLQLELSHEPTTALVDPIQLESAVLNLVINARDALAKGGHIWVNTAAAFSLGDPNLRDGPYVAVTVRDDGCGIAPELLEKVFDPFFYHQAGRTRYRSWAIDHLRFCPPVGRARVDPQRAGAGH